MVIVGYNSSKSIYCTLLFPAFHPQLRQKLKYQNLIYQKIWQKLPKIPIFGKFQIFSCRLTNCLVSTNKMSGRKAGSSLNCRRLINVITVINFKKSIKKNTKCWGAIFQNNNFFCRCIFCVIFPTK